MMNSMINTFDREAIHEEVQNEKELDFRILSLSMLLDRNPSIHDYKCFYAIDQQCSVELIVRITEIKYKKPEEFNPNGICFSEIRSVVRAMDYYELDNEFQTRINYRLILIICYINFFLIVTICIILPSTTKESCGNGLQWKSHFMMAGFLFANFVVEISLFFIAIPRDLLLKILISAKGDLRDNAWNIWATFLAIVINGWFLVSGIISKLSINNFINIENKKISTIILY